MGNFLKDSNENIAIPSTKISVMIRLSSIQAGYKTDNIKNWISFWGKTGFTFNFVDFMLGDEINTKLFERTFNTGGA